MESKKNPSPESEAAAAPPALSSHSGEKKAGPILPPSPGESTVVPPILTEQQKDSQKSKNSRKSFKERLFAFFTFLAKDEMLGTTVSFSAHFFLFLFFALIVFQPSQLPRTLLSGGFSTREDGLEDGDGTKIALIEEPFTSPIELPISPLDHAGEKQEVKPTDPGTVSPDPQNSTSEKENGSDEPRENEIEPREIELLISPEMLARGGGFENRNTQARGKRGGPGDPTEESEKAVELGLKWIAQHQDRDGGWRFNLGDCGTKNLCTHPGTHFSRTAATAIALLPFLGAGYTHLDGQYKGVVEKGLRFLLDPRICIEQSNGANLMKGPQGMYSQGIATIALCEAYGMTRGRAKNDSEKRLEQRLRIAAQNAIRFLEYSQDVRGQYSGGWRYNPGSSPGDISVSGWSGLALKSGLLSGLEVKSTTLTNLDRFLTFTEYDSGSRFNYLPLRFSEGSRIEVGERSGKYPDSEFTCTAVGLLMRMYLGRGPGYEPLDRGVSLLSEWGPLKSSKPAQSSQGHCNLYYAYYGTLVLHHYGGSGWNRWFPELREFLVRTQVHGGHESGSWFFSDPYCDVGGRLLYTSFATMILEVRYRYLPLYDGL